MSTESVDQSFGERSPTRGVCAPISDVFPGSPRPRRGWTAGRDAGFRAKRDARASRVAPIRLGREGRGAVARARAASPPVARRHVARARRGKNEEDTLQAGERSNEASALARLAWGRTVVHAEDLESSRRARVFRHVGVVRAGERVRHDGDARSARRPRASRTRGNARASTGTRARSGRFADASPERPRSRRRRARRRRHRRARRRCRHGVRPQTAHTPLTRATARHRARFQKFDILAVCRLRNSGQSRVCARVTLAATCR